MTLSRCQERAYVHHINCSRIAALLRPAAAASRSVRMRQFTPFWCAAARRRRAPPPPCLGLCRLCLSPNHRPIQTSIEIDGSEVLNFRNIHFHTAKTHSRHGNSSNVRFAPKSSHAHRRGSKPTSSEDTGFGKVGTPVRRAIYSGQDNRPSAALIAPGSLP